MKSNAVTTNGKNRINRMKNRVSYAGAMISLAAAGMLPLVNAASDSKGLMEMVIKIVSRLILIPAAILCCVGVVQYASAHSDGDGPAQKKAVNFIASGIMLAALSVILYGAAGQFSAMVNTSI